MKTQLMTGITLAALGLGAAGCGSGGDTGAVDDFVKAMAQAECAWEFHCCTDAEIQQQEMGKYKDQATCEQFQELALQDLHYAERLAVKQGRITVDSSQSQACVAATSGKQCNAMAGAPPQPQPMPGSVDPCTLVFKGATAVGDACQFENECKKGAHCVATGSGAEGVCVPYQEEMQICNTSSDCDPTVFNLYCAKKDFQCHLRSPAGGPCAFTIDPVTQKPTTPLELECDRTTGDLYCDATTMTCQTLPAAGQPCLTPPLPPGVSSPCAAGLVCDTGGSNTCRGPGAVGDDCTRIACQTTLYCDRTVTPNSCKALPTLGEMCQQSSFECAKPYYCNTSMTPYVCAQPAQLGDPCGTGAVMCDTGLYCDVTMSPRTCKMKLPDGATCNQSQMCLSDLCTFNGTSGVCAPSTVAVQCSGR